MAVSDRSGGRVVARQLDPTGLRAGDSEENAVDSSAVLPLTELPATVRLLPLREKIPPASAKRPYGRTARATLPATRLSRTTRVAPNSFMMPPPSASLVIGPPATLFVTATPFSVVPALSMPAPLASARGQRLPDGLLDGTLLAGTTRLSLSTLGDARGLRRPGGCARKERCTFVGRTALSSGEGGIRTLRAQPFTDLATATSAVAWQGFALPSHSVT
jgi:hypothetical protein